MGLKQMTAMSAEKFTLAALRLPQMQKSLSDPTRVRFDSDFCRFITKLLCFRITSGVN